MTSISCLGVEANGGIHPLNRRTYRPGYEKVLQSTCSDVCIGNGQPTSADIISASSPTTSKKLPLAHH